MEELRSDMTTEKKTKLRFSFQDDICLLKETLSNNPFGNKNKWKIVYNNFMKVTQKKFSFRAVRDHVDYLLTQYLKEDRRNIRKSGTEEEYGEREQLLEELNSLKREFQMVGVKKKKENAEKGLEARRLAAVAFQNEESEGEEIIFEGFHDSFSSSSNTTRSSITNSYSIANEDPLQPAKQTDNEANDFEQNLSQASVPSTSRRKRKALTKSIAELLQERKEKDWNLESRRLDLEERRIALEEAKLKQITAVQEQQNNLILMLLQELKDKK